MGMNWTKEQKEVITVRDRNILVSAAAGSGKTAVLVERIIQRILEKEHPVDIDRMLIVTFTAAAAAQMRDRICAAIEDALEKDPENGRLMKQATLVHHAQITTIHSFCLSLIRDYFHRVDLEPNFRIAEEGELSLLQEDVAAEALNKNYEEASEAFLLFVECFATGKRDDGLKDMILKLYHFAMSYPWPKEWLRHLADEYRARDFEELETKPWMQALMEYLHRMFEDLLKLANQNVTLSCEEDGPAYLKETAERDMARLRHLAEAKDYKSLSGLVSSLSFDRLASKRGYEGDPNKLDRFKAQRDEIKNAVKKLKEKFFFSQEKELFDRLCGMAPVMEELVRLTEEFMDAYDAKKREKNILDFNDLEHFALKILINEETKVPTEAALSYRQMFEEVMIDEYQDSNLVQETILRTVSGEDEGMPNRFMVGDVKQSIYRFRLARPELFVEKYDTYTTEESSYQKIELHKNFRSRREVLDFTNRIFYRIMKKDLGNINYDQNAALNVGADYEDCGGMEAELILSDPEEETLKEAGLSDPIRLEAQLAAARIKKLLREQKVTDQKTGALRAVHYSDIVILLRSFGAYADTFLEVFEENGIPAHASSKTGYFKALEIQTILSLLRILDNPRQDIALAAVLRSPMFGFSDEELAMLKAYGSGKAFHSCVLEPDFEKLPQKLSLKLNAFLNKLSSFRDLVMELPIHALLYHILEDTGYARYAAAMPAGERRKANIEMLLEKAAVYEKTSYRGLFHFIRYMDRLQKYEVDYGEAEVVSENADAVRIMTIHKSKGLEFPIVFLCGTAKKFNRMDARSSMVLHPEFGAALDYVDPFRRVRGATLYKKAAANQIEMENQGEELRVLYVALTRAKEKLIITGVAKDAKKKIEKFFMLQPKDEEISFFLRAGANSFLDLLLPAMISNGDGERIRLWGAEALVKEETERRLDRAEGFSWLLEQIDKEDPPVDAFVKERLSYSYPKQLEVNRKMKYSVSELKRRAREAVLEEEDLQMFFGEEEIVPYIPRFAGGGTQENQGTLRGNAVHRAMELLPVKRLAGNENAKEELETLLAELVQLGRYDAKMLALLQKDKVIRFYGTTLAARMKRAAERNELYMEQPFVLGRPAKEIEGDGSDTIVLIQGIIDVFFIEDGEIVLLDYKTDVVKSEKELIRRYKEQLNWYQKALEENLSKRVKEKLIYSFWLEKEIAVK